MKFNRRTLTNHAVVGVVSAVLLVGLIVSVVALIQKEYVPKIMKQQEADHMDDVYNQFAQLKYAIDSQVARPS